MASLLMLDMRGDLETSGSLQAALLTLNVQFLSNGGVTPSAPRGTFMSAGRLRACSLVRSAVMDVQRHRLPRIRQRRRRLTHWPASSSLPQ